MASGTATGPVQGYSYARPSALDGGLLGLSTSGGTTAAGPAAHPRFFSGLLTEAAPAAAALPALADVARTRYHQPRPTAFRDPVVTCNGDRLRMESFSACCGVYGRLDVLQAALDGDVHERGTTNVDVNGPLREALARVGGGDPLHLAVGAEELAVTTHTEVWTAIEHALASVLAAHDARPVTGPADLLALGTRTAEIAGARARIQELEAVAARRGSSRTVKEAARLHAYLTRP